MTSIAIVGSGVSGLHLGLFLQQHDVPVTLYSDKTAEQIATGRLLNTVAHHHHTLERVRLRLPPARRRRPPRADALARRLPAPVVDHRLSPVPAAAAPGLRGA